MDINIGAAAEHTNRVHMILASGTESRNRELYIEIIHKRIFPPSGVTKKI